MKLKTTISDIIDAKEISTWTPDTPVIIKAGTGYGKSYFIKNSLYEYAKSQNEKILMVLPRKYCEQQFSEELKEAGKNETIELCTYQALEKDNFILSKYRYIVCDEFHYFTDDSRFNFWTDKSFERIENAAGAIRIYMSATAETVGYMISVKDKKYIAKEYSLENNWDHIKQLHFSYDKDFAEQFIENAIATKQKGILFIESANEAFKLHKKYEEVSTFCCSEYNKEHKDDVDREEIGKILKAEKFEKQFLITTSCMDCGINIIDTELHQIYLDITDVSSLIQCIGRKRSQNKEDTVELYIHAISNIGGLVK